MTQEPRPRDDDTSDLTPSEARHRRFGLKLFFVYLIVYVGFIAVSTLYHDVLSSPALFGMNLAVVYGFGLIVLAFVLAMTYLFADKPTPLTQSADRRET